MDDDDGAVLRFDGADFNETASGVAADVKREAFVVDFDPEGVAVGVENVFVGDPCLRALSAMTVSITRYLVEGRLTS